MIFSKSSLLPLRFWRTFVLIFTPVLLLPVPTNSPSEAGKCAYVMLIIAIYWMTEAIPLSVTALLPVLLFPLLGILSTNEVCVAYMNSTNMMYLGGLIIAVSIEHCNLHRRIALFVILHIGQSPRRLMAGFMIPTAFFSIWISNAATAAMMVPIVDAILQELIKCDSSFKYNKSICRNLKVMCFLATAYAANIGGTGSPLGSGANLVTVNVIESNFREPTELNFGTWVLFNVPGLILCVFFAWIWLQFLFIGIGKNSSLPSQPLKQKIQVRNLIKNQYDDLGNMTFHEVSVIMAFLLALCLWVTRQPGFTHGWASVFSGWHGNVQISDATSTILIVVLLFALPAKLMFWPFVKKNDKFGTSKGCLTWEIVEKRVCWGTVILLGGGFAMAKASNKTQLSLWIGEQLKALKILPVPLIVMLVTIFTALITEIASNSATSSILMPVLNDLALGLCINPLYLMIPATASCCYAFILPAASPANAIVYSAASMKSSDMIKAGIVMNIICIIVVNIMINTLGVFMFGVRETPSWLNSTIDDVQVSC